jgi:hypothetical protein
MVPLGRTIAVALAAAAGALAILMMGDSTSSVEQSTPASPVPAVSFIRVTVSPPAYLGVTPTTLENPAEVEVPAGSTVHLEVGVSAGVAWVEWPGAPVRALARGDGDGSFRAEWVPDTTETLVVAAGQAVGQSTGSRLLPVVVVPDQPPRVRIVEPGRDLAFATPSASVGVLVEAEDAERLDGLRVAYVKTSGSGETFAFAEGQVPVTLERLSARHWRGRASLPLAALGVGDGDTLVYRALARDVNPDGDWISSDAYTVDVGARLEFAGAGFAVPIEDRRYAISQQMVIVKTERLQAQRATLTPDVWMEESRGLAVEQRMVRAEVVFLSGGEVQDEVEEAAHSHELQEGRLENAGRAEMLRALNEMSRAEARLNAGDTAGALVFERAALAALQRAFDRRRYFLRTLSERSRIDGTRRLTGNMREARSSERVTSAPEDDLSAWRVLAQDLAQLTDSGDPAGPDLLARVASIEGSAEWQAVAAGLVAATTPAARRDAARVAMVRLSEVARARLGATREPIQLDEIRGWWRDEWPVRRPR